MHRRLRDLRRLRVPLSGTGDVREDGLTVFCLIRLTD